MNALPPLIFNEKYGWWEFTFTLKSGRDVQGRISSYNDAPADDFKARIAAFTQWLQEHEKEVRAYITEQMFDDWLHDWHDDESDRVRTPLGFQRKISLSSFHVYEDPENSEEQSAEVYFNDGNLFAGHVIILSLKLDGTFDGEPYIAG